MSRIARQDMPGTFYHAMCQGINKEYIFNDTYLKEKYKSIVKEKIKDKNIKIIAYCIMDNHVHLLLNAYKNNDMSKFMQQLNTSYARLYNKTKNRVGYVFRDRYLSKTINTELQLQRCMVYIHKNPIVAQIVKNEKDYKFSSYNEYLNYNKYNLICKEARNIVFGTENYIQFLEEYKYIHRIKDEELIEFDSFEDTIDINIKDLLKKYENLTKEEQIIQFNLKYRVSERRLAQIFNITRHQIRNILKNK